MPTAVKLPKRFTGEELQQLLGDKQFERFTERWAAHRVGFQHVPQLTPEALATALDALTGNRPIAYNELQCIAKVAMNYWTAVPHAKGRMQTWMKLTRDSFQKELAQANGKKRSRKRGK